MNVRTGKERWRDLHQGGVLNDDLFWTKTGFKCVHEYFFFSRDTQRWTTFHSLIFFLADVIIINNTLHIIYLILNLTVSYSLDSPSVSSRTSTVL